MGHWKNLLKSSFVNVLEHAVKMAVMLYSAPLMLTTLGAEGYGSWLLAMTVVGFFLILDVGVSVATTRFMAIALGAGSQEQEAAVVTVARGIFTKIGAAMLVCTFAAAPFMPFVAAGSLGVWEVMTPVLICGASTSARFWYRMPVVVLRANVRYDLLAWASILRSLVQIIIMTVVLHAGYGLMGAALVHGGGDLFELLLQRHFSRRFRLVDCEVGEEVLKDTRKGVFAYCKSFMLASFGKGFWMQMNPLIVSRYAGLAAVPVYSVGMRLITTLEDVVNAIFGGQVFSLFSQLHGAGKADDLVRQFRRVLQVTVPFSAWAVGGLIFFGDAFFHRWLGESFAGAHDVMVMLSLPYGLRFMQYPSATLLLTLNRQKWLIWENFLGGLVTFAFALWLGPIYGIKGVVAGTALEMVVFYLFAMPWLISQCTGIHPVKYIFVMVLLRAAVSLLLPAVFAWWALTWLEPDYGQLFLAAAGYSLVFALVAPWVALDREARKTLANLLAAKMGRRRSSAA